MEVFADSMQEAIDKAQEADLMSFCHQCGNKQSEWHTSELDCGPPEACELVDVFVDGKTLDPFTLQELWGKG